MIGTRCPAGILWYVESTGLRELFVWACSDAGHHRPFPPEEAFAKSLEPFRERTEKGGQVDWFTRLFGTWSFFGHWDFGSMTPNLGWLHVMSDLGLCSAFLAIACVLGFFVLRRRKTPFRAVLWLVTALAFACGTMHLVEAMVFWWPAERLATFMKLLTAIMSWAALIALVFLVPRALAMRSPQEL